MAAGLCALTACGNSDPPVQRLATPPGLDLSRPVLAYRASGLAADASGFETQRYGTGVRAMEPSFAFARDGSILYQGWQLNDAAPGGVPAVPAVLRSADGGMSWEDVTPLGHPSSLDPVLYQDEDTGRIFSLNWAANAQPSGSTLSYTDDAGATWVTTPLACCGFDGQSLGAGPPVSSVPVGYANLVYYCTGSTLGSSEPLTTPICSKSLNGGLSFAPTGGLPYPAMDEQDLFAVWPGSPVVGPDGILYLPKRHNGQPQIAISRDEGLSWTQVVVADNGSSSQASRMAVDDEGSLYYTWTADDHQAYIAWSRDQGATWSAPIRITPPGLVEAALPRIAVQQPGKIAVAYLGSLNSPGAPYYEFCNGLLSSCTEGNYADVTWNGYLALLEDVFASDPLIVTGRINDADRPLFHGGCSGEGACKANLDFLDAHFDASGNAWGAYVDDCALVRGFTPLFTADTPPCGDYVGEGILGRLASSY